MPDHRFCVAPMMDWTDRHDRYFLRLLSKHTLLYTEMITSAALVRGKALHLLEHDALEHPLAVQLGGSDPVELAEAASLAQDAGYDEVNLNVGCPSDRVQSGAFGACLMAEPELVADSISTMQARVNIPVTVKCRIGIDDQDSEEELSRFVETVSDAGCKVFIIHARKAILSGLSPKQNRQIPPLDYQRVLAIKKAFPNLCIIINGGISNLDSAAEFLAKLDGVMLGREAYQNPYILHSVDARFFHTQQSAFTRLEYLQQFIPYMETQLAKGVPLQHMTRHILGLFKGEAGGRQFRRHLSENGHGKDAKLDVLFQAMEIIHNYAIANSSDNDQPKVNLC